jgi:hypothetical protein
VIHTGSNPYGHWSLWTLVGDSLSLGYLDLREAVRISLNPYRRWSLLMLVLLMLVAVVNPDEKAADPRTAEYAGFNKAGPRTAECTGFNKADPRTAE